MVNESAEQPNRIDSLHTSDHAEQLAPGLVRGKLISDTSGYGRVYEGLFENSPVIIKQANNQKHIPKIQAELDFISKPPIQPFEVKFSDYGIPSDWRLTARFVRPILNEPTRELRNKGVIVMEKVQGEELGDLHFGRPNVNLKNEFHFASVASWIDVLRKLAKKGVSMDSNIDSDLLISPDFESKRLTVVRIDCMPSVYPVGGGAMLTPVHHAAHLISRGYGKLHPSLENMLPGVEKVGTTDPEVLHKMFTSVMNDFYGTRKKTGLSSIFRR